VGPQLNDLHRRENESANEDREIHANHREHRKPCRGASPSAPGQARHATFPHGGAGRG
jgi:hypothetical protein